MIRSEGEAMSVKTDIPASVGMVKFICAVPKGGHSL